ncbi:MAG: dTMP kinase [Rhodospirillales bacterium]|nr:dTMP kinase [Rhodospirillales bacterium]
MTGGKFITFEGGEGAGKSTQVRRLATAMAAAGQPVLTTREPGGAAGAEQIRSLLVSGAIDRWQPMSEALLNYAARAEHVAQTIEPALRRGDWVVSDRFADSTLAYQGYGHGLDPEKLKSLHHITLGDFQPDLTYVLDLPVEEGLRRAMARGDGEDRYERMGIDFHNRLRDGFLEIAGADPERCVVIDGTADMDTIQQSIWAALQHKFPGRFQ